MKGNELILIIRCLMIKKGGLGSNDSENANAILFEIEALLKEYLARHPHDAQMWLRLGLTYFDIPWVSYEEAIPCLEKVLAFEPANAKALLCLAYYVWILKSFDEEIFKKLLAITPCDPQYASMIEYMKAMYYGAIDDYVNYEICLRKSIQSWRGHANNFSELGSFLFETNPQEAQQYLAMAERNKRIISLKQYGEQFYDRTDIENFLDEYIRGIYKIDESTLK